MIEKNIVEIILAEKKSCLNIRNTTRYVHLISQNIVFANLVNIIVESIEQSSHLFSSSNFRPVVMKKVPQLGDKIMFNFHLKPPFFISGLWYFAFGQPLQFRIYLQTKNVWNKSSWRGDLNFLCKVGDFCIWTLFISSELQLKGYFWKGKDITKLASSENFSLAWYIPYSLWNDVDLGEGPGGKYAISRLNPEPYLHKICRVINFSVPNVHRKRWHILYITSNYIVLMLKWEMPVANPSREFCSVLLCC